MLERIIESQINETHKFNEGLIFVCSDIAFSVDNFPKWLPQLN